VRRRIYDICRRKLNLPHLVSILLGRSVLSCPDQGLVASSKTYLFAIEVSEFTWRGHPHVDYHCPTLILSTLMDIRSALRPMKLVMFADELMQYAETLFRERQSIMRSDDRVLAEDRMLW
jgi:hypothetical protein